MKARPNTRARQAAFLAAFAETGQMTAAARIVGVRIHDIYKWLTRHPDFRPALDEAAERGTQVLMDEAVRRAKDGVKRPVHYQGRRVDEVVEYSDGLLMFLLKARRPDLFKDRHEHSGADGAPITVTWLPPDRS